MGGQRVQRRLAAILAMDMVGYSRQMAADETGTLARLKGMRKEIIDPALSEHGGRIVKEIGDGLLVEFASAVSAVECAAKMQLLLAEANAAGDEDKQTRFRVGVNLGDMIVEGEDIYGDGVNIAARLESFAEPDGICASLSVYNQVKNRVSYGFSDLGEHSFKNLAEPVRVFAVETGDDAASAAAAEPNAAVLKRPAIAVLPLLNLRVELNPSDPFAYMQLGSALDFTGKSEEAVSIVEMAHDLNPQSLDRYGAACIVARAHLHAGDYEQAIEHARRAIDLRPAFHQSYVVLAASLAHAGRAPEGREALAQGRTVRPDFVEHWIEWPLYVLKEQKALVIAGLRRLGWDGDLA